MTLIAVGTNSSLRRCDARCHNAAQPKCDCICGGRYHGLKRGSQELQEAIEQTERAFLAAVEMAGGHPSTRAFRIDQLFSV